MRDVAYTINNCLREVTALQVDRCLVDSIKDSSAASFTLRAGRHWSKAILLMLLYPEKHCPQSHDNSVSKLLTQCGTQKTKDAQALEIQELLDRLKSHPEIQINNSEVGIVFQNCFVDALDKNSFRTTSIYLVRAYLGDLIKWGYRKDEAELFLRILWIYTRKYGSWDKLQDVEKMEFFAESVDFGETTEKEPKTSQSSHQRSSERNDVILGEHEKKALLRRKEIRPITDEELDVKIENLCRKITLFKVKRWLSSGLQDSSAVSFTLSAGRYWSKMILLMLLYPEKHCPQNHNTSISKSLAECGSKKSQCAKILEIQELLDRLQNHPEIHVNSSEVGIIFQNCFVDALDRKFFRETCIYAVRGYLNDLIEWGEHKDEAELFLRILWIYTRKYGAWDKLEDFEREMEFVAESVDFDEDKK